MSFITWIKGLFTRKPKDSKYNLLIVRSKSKPTCRENGSEIAIVLDPKCEVKCGNIISANDRDFRKLPFKISASGIFGKGDLWYALTTHTSTKKEIKRGEGYAFPKKRQNENKISWHWEKDSDFVTKVLKADAEEKNKEVIGGKIDNTGISGNSDAKAYAEEKKAVIGEKTDNTGFSGNSDAESYNASQKNDDQETASTTPEKVEDEPKNEEEINTGHKNEENAQDEKVEEVKLEDEEKVASQVSEKSAPKVGDKVDVTKANSNGENDINGKEVPDEQINNIINQNQELLKGIQNILKMNTKNQVSPSELLKKLKDYIETLKQNAREATDANNNLQRQNENLTEAKNRAEQEKVNLDNAKRQAETNARNAKEELERKHRNEVGEIRKQLNNVTTEKEVLIARVTELEKSDVGKLMADLTKAKDDVLRVSKEKDIANENLRAKEQDLANKDNEIDTLRSKNEDLGRELSKKEADAVNLTTKLTKAEETIRTHERTIVDLNQEKTQCESDLTSTRDTLAITQSKLTAAQHENTGLNSQIGALNLNIGKLNRDIETITSEKEELENIAANDIEMLLATYSSAAEDLRGAITEDFISECNPDEDNSTVESMCEKIRRGVGNVVEEIEGLKSKEYKSVKEAVDSFNTIITDNIEGKTFTEIARWWAYSRLPFIANKDREQGRAIALPFINAAYAALERLLAMAGYNYQIPTLFVENLEDGEYVDLTGREQLNLEYQFPNVRSHAENIDRADRNSTILDIVSLGYYRDGKLEKKTSIIH